MTDTTQTPSSGAARALSGRGILQATGLVMIGFILSRVLGLVRDMVIANIFGGTTDIFFAALRPPETVFFVIAGGALGSAFIPTFVGYLAKSDEENAWKMASIVTNLLTLILVVICALAAIFAPTVVRLFLAPKFNSAEVAETANLMRIMLLSPIIFGLSGLVMAILNAKQRFLMPALAPGLYNLGIIFGALVLTPYMGFYGLAWGTVLGALMHLGAQIPDLLNLKPRYWPNLSLQHPGVQEVLRLMGPRMLGLAIVQINFWVVIALASGMVEGSISALDRAFKLLLLPQGVIAQSIAIAVFPTFSAQVAEQDHSGLRRTLAQVLRAVLFLSIPATVGLVLLREPIVRVIFERGKFTPDDTQAVAWALLFYGLGLVSHSVLEVITRAYYALHDTRTPVIFGGAAMLLNIAFSLIFMQVIGDWASLTHGPFGGLALAMTAATTIETLLLVVIIRPRVGGLDIGALGIGAVRTLIASATMGIVIWLAATPVLDMLGRYLGLLALIAVGGAVFWGIAWVLGSEDARYFTSMALSRLRRTEA